MVKKMSHMNYIAKQLKGYGWSKKATEACLANCKAESAYNPKAEQAGLAVGTGFGLWQWSVNQNITLGNCLAQKNMTNAKAIRLQCQKLQTEAQQWIAGGRYPMSFHDFKINAQNLSRRALTVAFMQQWERPADHSYAAGSARFTRWLPDFIKLRW